MIAFFGGLIGTIVGFFLRLAGLAAMIIGFIVVLAIVFIVGSWAISITGSLGRAAQSEQTRANIDNALAYVGSAISMVLPTPAPAPPATTPARTLLRPDWPEKRADGSVWIVRQWFDGVYQDLYQAEPPTAAPAPAAPASQAGSVQPVAQQAASCNSQRETRVAAVGQGWTPNGSRRIVNFWTNEPGKNQAERKLILATGQNPVLFGGGSSWSWPAGCEATVQSEFAKNSLPEVSLDQLRAEGLAR